MATKPPPPPPPLPAQPPPPQKQQPVNFFTITAETKRIVKTHFRHFLSLALIFLLPISISAFFLPKTPSLLLFLISIFSNVFSLLATGSISYSAYHAFYNRPISVVQSIKSSLSSFFPLLFTFLLSQILILSTIIAAGILIVLASLLFKMQLYSPNYTLSPTFVVIFLIFFVILVYFQINYNALSFAVVVVESKWGADAFRRSHHLIKGMKTLGVLLLLYYGVPACLLVWYKSWTNSDSVIIQVMAIVFVMMLSLANIVSFTVLYIHCKDKEVDGGGGDEEVQEIDVKEPLLSYAV